MKSLMLAALLLGSGAAAEPAFSPARIEADVTFLADDLLEGRGTGERGHEIAARYVAAQFAIAGLKPGAKDGTWFQRVTLRETRRDGPASVTIGGPAGRSVWPSGIDAIAWPGETAPTADVAAGAVFVGYGIDAPAHGFDDYAGLDVRGRIVVMLGGIPDGPPDETIAHLAKGKAEMAAARGAIGVVTVASRAYRKLRPWDKIVTSADVPRMTWVAADGVAHADAPGIRATATLNDNAAAALFAGSRLTFEQVRDAAAATKGGHPKGFALAATVGIAARAAYRTITSPEVIGVIPGSDPALEAETIVLMGHLDHLGIRPGNSGDKIYNGALDNAAGVAVMLEVARGFAAEAAKPRRTLMFVANTAEEKGLLGAEAFANDPPVPIERIAAVVDLDQPLLLYDFTDVIAFGGDHSTMGASIARAVAGAGVRLSPDPMPAETIFVRSDHYTFVKRGVPGLLLATGYANGGEAAWKHFLSTDYHQPSDDLTQKIDWTAAAKYARVNYLIARDLADAATRPRWYAGDYFGETFAPAAPKVPRR